MRAGLIGMGAMGRHHARVLQGLDDVELVGVVDPAVPWVLHSLDDLLTRQPDYAVVAVPAVAHAAVAERLIDAGVHLLVEKPLAPTVDECLHLAGLLDAAGLVGGVGFIERCNPAVITARRHLPIIGQVLQVDTRRRGPRPQRVSDVGVAADLATHDIDLVSWMMRSRYERLSAERVGEDSVIAVGRLESGVAVSHVIDWMTPRKERTTTIVGRYGALVVDTLAGVTWHHVEGRDPVRLRGDDTEPLLVEHERFLDAVRHGVSGVLPSFADGAEVMRVVDLITSD